MTFKTTIKDLIPQSVFDEFHNVNIDIESSDEEMSIRENQERIEKKMKWAAKERELMKRKKSKIVAECSEDRLDSITHPAGPIR